MKVLLCLKVQFPMTASMVVTAFLNIAPCNLVEVDRRFRGVTASISLMMESVSVSETPAQYLATHSSILSPLFLLHKLRFSQEVSQSALSISDINNTANLQAAGTSV
jgi:hypothetical protein